LYLPVLFCGSTALLSCVLPRFYSILHCRPADSSRALALKPESLSPRMVGSPPFLWQKELALFRSKRAFLLGFLQQLRVPPYFALYLSHTCPILTASDLFCQDFLRCLSFSFERSKHDAEMQTPKAICFPLHFERFPFNTIEFSLLSKFAVD